MSCKFSVSFKESPSAFHQKVKSKIEKHGGKLSGNATSGRFVIPILGGVSKVEGEYTIGKNKITIHVTHQPPLVSCSVIEKTFRSYL
ncbi:MAG: hypothetical protein B6242_14965 [Anaerolineaceae bacterium 4572_78]|nr:MAG: hypothetical protein B6242_14965 [Anaerolineaceae bacterium 4572_78]